MNENCILLVILSFGYLIAPFFSNRFFLFQSKIYKQVHLISFFLLLLAINCNIPKLTITWTFFSGFGIILFCRIYWKNLFLFHTWIKLVPLGFGFLSSIWFFCGMNECHLLGYQTTWSYYAAIHSCFIGWLFLSGISYLSARNLSTKIAIFFNLAIVIFFLIIAFGIYGNPFLKKLGVVGYSILLPVAILHSKILFQNPNRISQFLGRCSLFFLCLTFLIALFHEFYSDFPKYIFGFPLMVLVHGSINAFLVIPCFLGSIVFREIKPLQ